MVGPVIPPNPVNDTDPCPWFIDGGDGWGCGGDPDGP